MEMQEFTGGKNISTWFSNREHGMKNVLLAPSLNAKIKTFGTILEKNGEKQSII